MNNNELCHHGVKGMKWGVRRKLGKRGKNNSERASENYHADYLQAHSKQSAKTMSDAELRRRINRLQMEQQYSKLTKEQISTGRKVVTDILANAAKDTAKQYVSKGMRKGIDGMMSATQKKRNGRR